MPRTLSMERSNVESAMSEDREVTCPAGDKVGETLEGPGCFCRLEGGLISVATDITSWSVYCTGRSDLDPLSGYLVCPTWRAARELERAHEPVGRLIAADGLRRNFSVEDIEEIEERREAGDTDGARAIQERIAEARREQGLRDVRRA